MNKYVSYIVLGIAVIVWLGFLFGLVYCNNFIPEGFEPDDLHLACFGIGLCGLPFLAGFGCLCFCAADAFTSLVRKKRSE